MEKEAQSNKSPMIASTALEQHSITTLAQASMFWRPHFLGDSPWVEHVPFAFWLIEAHQPNLIVEIGPGEGTSYFALCQAVERLKLNSKCYAIRLPSTTPDAQKTKEQEESIESHNEAFYSSFSSLPEATPDEACQHFPDSSIDLLNVDGLQTFEQTKHLLQSWLPRLSRRALILLHGTNIRDRGIQLHRLFQELGDQYPVFEFKHGNGLGVVAIGPNQSELVTRLLNVGERSENVQVVQDVFSRLGHACADRYSVKASRHQVMVLSRDLEALKQDRQELVERLSDTENALTEKAREMALLQVKIHQQVERQALERGQLVERSNLIQRLYDELRRDSKAQQADAAKTLELVQKRTEETAKLSLEKTDLDSKLKSLQRQIETDRQALQQKARNTDELQERVKSLEAALGKEREAWAKQKEQLEGALRKDQEASAKLTRQLEIAEDKLKKEAGQLLEAQTELLTEKDSTARRFRELAELTKLLEASDRREDELKNSHDRQTSKLAELERALESRDETVLELTDRIKERDVQIKDLQIQINNLSKQNKVLHRLKELADGRSRLTGKLSVDPESRRAIRLIQASGLFDADFYLRQYPDVARNAEARSNPVLHYVLVGALEGRNPSAKFNTDWYLEAYPDVAASMLNPLVHYILHGQSEGRLAKSRTTPGPD